MEEKITPINEIVAYIEEDGKAKSVEVLQAEVDQKIENVTVDTNFSRTVEDGMISILQDAHLNDEQFREAMKEKIKQSATDRAELEKTKVALEEQNLQYQSELLETQQKLNEYQQEDDGYNAKRNRRRFIYDGVKPIMTWIGISEPMNIVLMVFLTAILVVPFIVVKPISALLLGVDAEHRRKQAIAWLYTLLALFCTGAVMAMVLIPLSVYGKI